METLELYIQGVSCEAVQSGFFVTVRNNKKLLFISVPFMNCIVYY